MNTLKQCPRGHYYKGDTCPYCPTQYYPNSGSESTTHTAGANQHNPTSYPTDTPTSTAIGIEIPLCPHCGRPVRRYVPKPPKEVRISSINNMGDGVVPWNYEWEGRCESCGHDFNIEMHIDMGSTGPDNRERQTRVRVCAAGFNHHERTMSPGEGGVNTVLSGVEITNKNGRVFLSANELKHLIKVLHNSPILKQFDYYTEDVERNSVRT